MALALPVDITDPVQETEANSKVKTYQWTPEQIKEYLDKTYPGLKKPEGKKPVNAWQNANKPRK